MKNTILNIAFLVYLNIFTNNIENPRTCPSCESKMHELILYNNQLEKIVKLAHDDAARWMKMYSDEISNKAAYIEKNMTWYMDYIAKFTALEQKVSSNTSNSKK